VNRRFRFAPTPSRPIHVGSALAALFGWGFARAAEGAFILRVEDIDRARCRPEHERTLLEDLDWLGLDWDEGPGVGGERGPYRQSERMPLYDAAIAELLAAGKAYVCTCSRNDIRRAASAPHLHDLGTGREVPYPGTCRELEAARVLTEGQGGVRLALDRVIAGGAVRWDDMMLGEREEDPRETSGDVLLGRPGQPTYQLAVVVDDIAMGITDIVRGRDLDGSTARQLALRAALGGKPVRHGHHPLIVDEAGRKLSKRDEASPVARLREEGVDPRALVAEVGRAVGVFGGAVRTATAMDFADAVGPWARGERGGERAPWRDGRIG
jgi:glutamyl-tRNA synthetase